MFSEKEKLAAIVAKWLEPMAGQFFGAQVVEAFPVVGALNNKIKSSGWVSPGWSIAQDLEPLIANASAPMLRAAVRSVVMELPEEGAAEMAHGIADKALALGSLSIMEGRVVFERQDLERLKRLLEVNMPYEGPEGFEVIEG